MHYTYILALENGQFYIGSTGDLQNRMQQHLQGQTKTTARIRPVELVFYAAFKTKEKAVAFEMYLKTSSGFAFRNKLLL